MTTAAHEIRRVNRVSLRDEVYGQLKHLLLTQRFDPDARLNTTELERRLGVSRTPLNEALQRLATEGLIHVRPRRGFFVPLPTLQDTMELFDLRGVLETFAGERAVEQAGDHEIAKLRAIVNRQRLFTVEFPNDDEYEGFSRCDRDFHCALVDAAGNRRLSALYEQLDSHVQMTRVYYLDARSTMRQTHQEHLAILDALEARDPIALRSLLVAHIERFRCLVQKRLTETNLDDVSDEQAGEGT